MVSFSRRPVLAAWIAILVGALVSPLPVTEASAQLALRLETIRWKHPHTFQVQSFRVYWGTDRENRTQAAEIPATAQGLAGLYSTGILVPNDRTVFISMTAVGINGLESQHSAIAARFPANAAEATNLGTPGKPAPSTR